jgi:hypothetical protein
MTVRITYVMTIDGFVQHPEGELLLILEDWHRLKQYHAALGKEFISSNASGGSPTIAMQILESKGARFTKFGDAPSHSVFAPEDD